MNPSDVVFSDYVVKQKGEVVTIRAKLDYNGFEQIGIVMLYFIAPAIIYYIPIKGLLALPLKVIAMILAFLLAKKVIDQFFSQRIMVINKSTNHLISPMDKFHASLTDINDVSIVEDAFQKGNGQMQYRLKFILSDGEKTSAFAFTSFNKAEELVKLVKHTSENK